MKKITVGSVCSGIEAASVAWGDLEFDFRWFSEILKFPSDVLFSKYPDIPNLGDMKSIPNKILREEIPAPTIICGGTPCQSFSLAGYKKGLEDERGNLTLNFVDIIDANDEIRESLGKDKTIVLWENVEGVLRDKTNAFGCFLAALSGANNVFDPQGWPNAGFIRGPKRNVAWRVLDAKYFGLPQQRRRLYVLACGKEFYPEKILFDEFPCTLPGYQQAESFTKCGQDFQTFRGYTDCLYSAYGTKWNGNAAAYNGSLFISQNNRLRRLTPIECERLMGFPDNYTALPKCYLTNRYKALGNSWAVPVVKWIGQRIKKCLYKETDILNKSSNTVSRQAVRSFDGVDFFHVDTKIPQEQFSLDLDDKLNGTEVPHKPRYGNLYDIVQTESISENIYITPVGCQGILRRASERNLTISPPLHKALKSVANEWDKNKIESISRRQKRGSYMSA